MLDQRLGGGLRRVEELGESGLGMDGLAAIFSKGMEIATSVSALDLLDANRC